MPSYNYDDTESAVNQVRLLINDVGGEGGSQWIFSDEEIQRFLTLRGDSVFRAAATALRTIANNEAMTSKVITFLDVKTDGAKLADALRAGADEMEKQADEAEDSDFELAFAAVDIFSARSLRGRSIF